MVRVGGQAPAFRVPAIMDGGLRYLDSLQLRGRRVVLSFLPRLGLGETLFLDRHVQSAVETMEDITVLAVSPGERDLHESWISDVGKLRVILLADPLRRLRRIYGVRATGMPTQCESFIIDSEGILRFHLVHDLTRRGIHELVEVLKATQTEAVRPALERC